MIRLLPIVVFWFALPVAGSACIAAEPATTAATGPATQPVAVRPTGSLSNLRMLGPLLSGDGSRLVLNLSRSGPVESTVRVHDTATGRELHSRTVVGTRGHVSCCDIAPDGSRVLLTEYVLDGGIRTFYEVVDIPSGNTVWRREAGIGNARFLGGADRVVLEERRSDRGGRRLLSVIDSGAGRVLRRIDWDERLLCGVGWTSPDGTRMLCWEDRPGSPTHIYNIEQQRVACSLEEVPRIEPRQPMLQRFAADGDVLGYVGDTLVRWDGVTGRIVDLRPGPRGNQTRHAVCFPCPDLRLLYVTDRGTPLEVISLWTGEVLYRGPAGEPTAMISIAGRDGLLVVRLEAGLLVRRLPLAAVSSTDDPGTPRP